MGRRKAFTLVEILIVVVIMGIIATVIIGLFNNTTADAAEKALKDNLRTMRSSLQLYMAQHGAYPAAGSFEAQMTQYSDSSGATSVAKTATHIYGPYILRMPPLPLGTNRGETGITTTTYSDGFGWGYDATTGQFVANCPPSEVDDTGVSYASY
jgi:prepilin-type N-terminal cleavage/methylation domain-containing protein